MESQCTCGRPAVHQHQVNGAGLSLCGSCNAIFYLLRRNHTGQELRVAIPMIEREGDDNFLDRFSVMDPETHAPSSTSVLDVPHTVHTVNPTEEPGTDSFYRVLPPDYSMFVRKPPVLP